jgi:AraC-like DNA-binding protein
MPPGCGYVLPPHVRTRTWNEGAAPSVYRWSHLRITVLGGLDFFELFEVPPTLPPASGKILGAANVRHVALLESAEPYALPAVAERHELCAQVFAELARHARLRPKAAARLGAHARVRAALDYIHAHYAESVTRADLARTLFLSESRFHDVFRAATGLAPLEYLQTYRLRRAQELLASDGAGVAEVGRACGFADPFHFSRQFRKAFGESPRQYRESILRLTLAPRPPSV